MTLLYFYILIGALKAAISINDTNIKAIVIIIRDILLNHPNMGKDSSELTLNRCLDLIDKYIIYVLYLVKKF